MTRSYLFLLGGLFGGSLFRGGFLGRSGFFRRSGFLGGSCGLLRGGGSDINLHGHEFVVDFANLARIVGFEAGHDSGESLVAFDAVERRFDVVENAVDEQIRNAGFDLHGVRGDGADFVLLDCWPRTPSDILRMQTALSSTVMGLPFSFFLSMVATKEAASTMSVPSSHGIR